MGLTGGFEETEGQGEDLGLAEEIKIKKMRRVVQRGTPGKLSEHQPRADTKLSSLPGLMNVCHFDRKCQMP